MATNPIIAAMLQNNEAQLAIAEQDRRTKLDAQNTKDAEADRKLRTQQIEQQHDLQIQQLDLQRAIQQVQADAARLDAFNKLTDFAGKGGDLSQFEGSTGNPRKDAAGNGVITIPGTNLSFPKGTIPTAQQQQEQQFAETYGTARATTQGQFEGAEPFKQAEFKRDKELLDLRAKNDEASAIRIENLRAQNRLVELDKELKSREGIAKLNAQIDRERIAQQGRLSLELGSEEEASAVESYIDALAYDGSIDLDKVPAAKGFRNIVMGEMNDRKIKPLDKNTKELLTTIPKAGVLINLLQELSEVGSTYSGRASAFTGLSFGTTGPSGATAAGLKSQLKTASADLARLLGENSRISDQDRQFILNIYQEKLSKKDNKAAVKRVEEIVNSAIKGSLGKYSKEQATNILSLRGIDPKKLGYGGPRKLIDLPDGSVGFAPE